jgi:hypothetical protein
MNIYLREVSVGNQENVIMWIDDQIYNALDFNLQQSTAADL